MQHIAKSVQEIEYATRFRRPPASAPAPDFPTTASQWAAYRAALNQRPAEATCPACSGLRFVKDPKSLKAVPCLTCTKDARRQWLKANCGLEGEHLNIRLTDWQLGEWGTNNHGLQEQRQLARGAIQQVLERRAGLLTFWGDFGSGKTFALEIVVNEMRAQLVEAYYVPLAFVLDHLRELFAQKTEWSNYWQRLLDVPVLCLDEVTRFYETDWAVERLWMLVDTRYRRRASHLTLFATNSDPQVRLPTSEAIGYLYSRCRQGTLVELRGDMREASKEPPERHEEDNA